MSQAAARILKEDRRKNRVYWTLEEKDCLIAGIEKYGLGSWVKILCDPAYYFHESRSAIDLKDKYRNICKQKPEPGDQEVIDENTVISCIEDVTYPASSYAPLFRVRIEGRNGKRWIHAAPHTANWEQVLQDFTANIDSKKELALRLTEQAKKTAPATGRETGVAAANADEVARKLKKKIAARRKKVQPESDIESDKEEEWSSPEKTPVTSPIQRPTKSHTKRREDTLASAKKVPKSPLNRVALESANTKESSRKRSKSAVKKISKRSIVEGSSDENEIDEESNGTEESFDSLQSNEDDKDLEDAVRSRREQSSQYTTTESQQPLTQARSPMKTIPAVVISSKNSSRPPVAVSPAPLPATITTRGTRSSKATLPQPAAKPAKEGGVAKKEDARRVSNLMAATRLGGSVFDSIKSMFT